MSENFYIRIRGEVKGPLSREQIVSMIRKKRLGKHHELSPDAVTWSRAGDVEGLFESTVTSRDDDVAYALPASDGEEDQVNDSPEKPSSTATVSDNGSWYYAKGRNSLGPISSQELRTMLATGRLQGSDRVWNETMADWVPVGSLPQFAPLVFQPTSSQSTATRADLESISQSPSSQILTSSLFTLLLGGLTFLAGPVAAFIIIAVSSDAPVFGSSTTGRELVNMLIGIAGLTALPLFAAISGTLLGHHSLRIHRKSPAQFEGLGYALTGLIICYAFVTIAVTSLLIFLIALAVKST